MNLSQFTHLFALRQQLLGELGVPGPVRSRTSTTLRNRVVQELGRVSDAVAAAKPDHAVLVRNILHAAVAPVPSAGKPPTLPAITMTRKRAAPRKKKRT